jgi:hypothetical protein
MADSLKTAELIARLTDELAMWPCVDEIKTALAAMAQEIATAHKMMDQDKRDYDELKDRFDAQAQEIERLKGNPSRRILEYKWLDYLCVEGGCQSLVLKRRAETAEALVQELERKIEVQAYARWRNG